MEKYDELILSIATELAELIYNKTFENPSIPSAGLPKLFSECNFIQRIGTINIYKPAAKVVVEKMAAEFKEAFIIDPERLEIDGINVDHLLIERGLISAPVTTEMPNVDQPSSAVGVSPDNGVACQRCYQELATTTYSDLQVCKVCCRILNDEFDEEYR